MKNLKKFSLHNVGDVMQDSEMKKIFGGYSSSPWCKEGELLFSCVGNITSGCDNEYMFDLGAICAKKVSEARTMALEALKSQGADGYVAVSCT